MPELQIHKWIRPEVSKQSLYSVELPSCPIKLNQNESPWDLPENIKREILNRIGQHPWNRYPDLSLQHLRTKIAQKLDVIPESIVIAKGSNEILQSICNVVLRSSDPVCTLSPSFTLYHILSEQRGAKVLPSQLTNDFLPNTVDLLEKSKQARLNLICNPNSPTGTLLTLNLLRQLLEISEGLVVIDEAYVDFSGLTSLPLLKDYTNLIVTRTLSKAFALAGFRIGYAVMHPELYGEIRKGLLPFNVDIPACVALEVLLDYSELIENRAQQIIQARDQLITKLNELGSVRAWPSAANFFLLETPLEVKKLYQSLLKNGILVRDVSTYPGCEKKVRITVGSKEENKVLFECLKKIL